MANEIYHRSTWGNAVNDNAWGDVYEKFDATNKMFIRSDNYENSNETDKIIAAINPKPSILLTPTAYNNPPVDNFIQGLNTVKPVLTKSDNLIVNGNFATDSDWTKGDGWSISGGVASCDGSQSGFSLLSQSGTFNQDKDYEVTFTITSYTSGSVCSVGFTGGGSDSFTLNPSPIGVGTYSRVIRANGNTAVSVRVNPGGRSPAFIGSIDNIIVKEVTDADFDFQRLTTATRINSSGNVESVAANLPRIDYTGGTGQILLEPQTTNLLDYSEDFSQYSAGSDITIQSGFLAPDGTNNAYKLTKTGTSQPYLFDSAGMTTTTTRSIFAKTVSGTGTVNLLSHNSNTNNLFTLTENWQRFEVNSSNSTGVVNFYAVDFRGSSSLSEIIVFGANATNDQAFATSYIPTSGSTSTRNADAANNSGSSDLINSTEGVLYAEISSLANDGTSRRISLSSGSDANRVSLEIDETSNRIKVFMNGGSISAAIITFDASDLIQFNKIAIKYKSGDVSLFLNGTEEATSTSTNMPVGLDRLNFDGGNLSNDYFGNVKCVAVYKEALTDAQLTALTT